MLEWVKSGALRWLRHVKRMEENEFVRVYKGRIKGEGVTER